MEDFKMLNLYSNPVKAKLRKKLYSMKLVDVGTYPGSGNLIILAGIFRPYLREFLDFCFVYFENIIIWSAGKRKYVEKMCEIMFPLEHQQPIAILTYDDCEVGEEDYLKKPLEKIYKDKRLKGKNINETNTFILDDRDDTFSLNKKNGIKIPEFESDMSLEDITGHDDDAFLKLMAWLSGEKVLNSKDIRKLPKSKIFNKSLDEYSDTLNKEK